MIGKESITVDRTGIACVDVDYRDGGAVAASVWFTDWPVATPTGEAVAFIGSVAEYEPGVFYKRELPCLLAVLQSSPAMATIIVDGYVWLDTDRAGLGAYLYEAMGDVAIVGVAKTLYRSATGVVPIYRGASSTPLYVSAVGMPVDEAANCIRRMHGEYRVPTLLRYVDRLARTATPSV